MNKIAGNYDKEKQKKIKRLFRKAKIKDGASQDEINAKIIAYFAKDSWDLKVTLPDNLRSDQMFLLSLYKASPKTLYLFAPRKEDETLLNNISFMTEYIKLRVERDTELYYAYAVDSLLRSCFVSYRDIVMNPQFVTKIAEEFPDADIITCIKDSIIMNKYYINKQEEKQHLQEYETLLNSLPKELLLREVGKYGVISLRKIPTSLPIYVDLIEAGIKNDGFKSLSMLDIDKVVENKNLIIEAYKKDGVDELRKYINTTLSPHREHWYICHEEPHSYNYFSEKHAKVQKQIATDDEIVEILKEEQHLARLRTIERMDKIIDKQNSEDDNENF